MRCVDFATEWNEGQTGIGPAVKGIRPGSSLRSTQEPGAHCDVLLAFFPKPLQFFALRIVDPPEPRLCLRSAIERGGGSGQLKGEQLQYALRTKSTRKQEFTRGHGSPQATDCQCVFCHSRPVR